jgi:hypothetical protein
MTDLTACKHVYASRSGILYSVATLLLSGGLAVISQVTITPLLDGSADTKLDKCPQKQEMKDSLADFILISSVATFASMFLTILIELHSSRMFTRYGNDLPRLTGRLSAAFGAAACVKCVLLVCALYTVRKAYSAYPECERFKAANVTAELNKKITDTYAQTVRAIPRAFTFARS